MYLGWPIPNPGCQVPKDLEPITCLGDEEPTGIPELGPQKIESIWQLTEKLFRAGAHPAIQLCIRHNGRRVLHRGIGHAAGNGPDDPPDGPKTLLTLDTPINLFSAAKAVSAARMDAFRPGMSMPAPYAAPRSSSAAAWMAGSPAAMTLPSDERSSGLPAQSVITPPAPSTIGTSAA